MLENEIFNSVLRASLNENRYSLLTYYLHVFEYQCASNTHSMKRGSFLSWKVKWDEEPVCLDIRRDCVVTDAMREAKKKKFRVDRPLKVCGIYLTSHCVVNVCHSKVTFVGEGAVDYGGPRREFLRLLGTGAATSLFIGHPANKFFHMNAQALQVSLFMHLIVLPVMHIV